MNDIVASLLMLGAFSSGGSLPFWAVSNQYGLMPERSGGLVWMQAARPLQEGRTFQWEAGLSLAAQLQAATETSGSRVLVDQAYAGIRWKRIGLRAGLFHREREFVGAAEGLGSLSVSEGHLTESNNARSMPGYQLYLNPWPIPFTKERLKLEGFWGDYKTLDQRYVQGALVHRVGARLRWDIGRRFWIQAGIDHYALWGGTSPEYGPMPVTLGNYFRVASGRKADASGTVNDQLNVIGEQGGAELLRLGWKGDGWNLCFQYEKPYAATTGLAPWHTFPDGIYTLHFGYPEKDRWLSDALVEYHYTLWQGGTRFDYYKGLFGTENYFNNGEYKSGWTYFGRAICAPLFLNGVLSNEIMGTLSNRYKALHLGLSGKLFRQAPYRLMLTWSRHFGTYYFPLKGTSTYETDWKWWQPNTVDRGLPQFSAALSGLVPLRLTWGRQGGLDLLYGLSADVGEALPRAFCATLGVRVRIF